MIEREIKLSVPAAFSLPSLDGLGAHAHQLEAERISAVYYDTSDLSLLRWHCSLRWRSNDGWTVKLTAPGDGRALVRHEHVFPGSSGRVPDEARDLVAAFVRSAPVEAKARMRTVRTRVELRDDDGKQLLEVDLDDVSLLEGRRVTERFREIEVEIADGCPPELVDRVVGRLRAAGARAAGSTAKVVRALGPPGPPDVDPPAVDADSPASHVITAAIATSVARLLTHDPHVRIGEDPEGVHQARVATRRLRSDLETFEPLLDADWAAGLRADLRLIARRLGRVRDADVLGMWLRRELEGLEASDSARGAALLDRLARRRDKARARLLDAMRDPSYIALLDRLIAAARIPQLKPAAQAPATDVVPALVAARWGSLEAAADEARADPSPAALHEVRIRAKHVRYAAEAVEPVLGKPARAFAKSAARLQDVLGEHQDAVVTIDWLRETSDRARGGVGFVAGLLAARAQEAAGGPRDAWRKRLARLAKRRFWETA